MSKLNLGALFGSKKFKVFLMAKIAILLVYAASYAGLDPEIAKAVAPDLAKWIVLIAAAYIGGQGLADLGKEKAKLISRDEAHARAASKPGA